MKCNRVQLADVHGVQPVTIDSWVKDGMPYLEKPDREAGTSQWLFDSGTTIEWRCDRDSMGEKRDEAKEAKTKELVASAGLKWLEYGAAMKAMLNIADIMPVIEEAIAIVKSRLRAIPGRLAQTLAVESDPAAVQRILKQEVDDALGELNKDFAEEGLRRSE